MKIVPMNSTDGTDEPDDKDSAGVEAINGNEGDYDFSPSNNPYEDPNNDYDENSNNMT